MSVEIIIDLNVRVEGDRTYAGFEDVLGGFVEDLVPGGPVMVVEEESDLVGPATVERIDFARQLIYLNVAWSSLAPRPAVAMDPAAHTVQRVLYTDLPGLQELTLREGMTNQATYRGENQ